MNRCLLSVLVLFFITGQIQADAQINEPSNDESVFWSISPAQDAIVWDVTKGSNVPHADDIEMSGQRISSIIRYAVDSRNYLSINSDIIFPQLRRYISTSEPDWQIYRAYLRKNFDDDFVPALVFNDMVLHPKLDSVRIDGKLTFFHSPIEPSGLNSLMIRPQIPSHWDDFSIESCRVMNRNLDFTISRKDNKMNLLVTENGKKVWQGVVHNGKSVEIKL